MDEAMSKVRLVQELRAARSEWLALLAEIDADRVTEAGATGFWSVKDVIAHLNRYALWYANAAEAQLRGEAPPTDGTEGLPFDERNQIYYEWDRDRPLSELIHDSERNYARLVAAVEQLPETFLIEPQQFPDLPEPVYIWQMLRGDVYDHTRIHIRDIQAWIDV